MSWLQREIAPLWSKDSRTAHELSDVTHGLGPISDADWILVDPFANA